MSIDWSVFGLKAHVFFIFFNLYFTSAQRWRLGFHLMRETSSRWSTCTRAESLCGSSSVATQRSKVTACFPSAVTSGNIWTTSGGRSCTSRGDTMTCTGPWSWTASCLRPIWGCCSCTTKATAPCVDTPSSHWDASPSTTSWWKNQSRRRPRWTYTVPAVWWRRLSSTLAVKREEWGFSVCQRLRLPQVEHSETLIVTKWSSEAPHNPDHLVSCPFRVALLTTFLRFFL